MEKEIEKQVNEAKSTTQDTMKCATEELKTIEKLGKHERAIERDLNKQFDKAKADVEKEIAALKDNSGTVDCVNKCKPGRFLFYNFKRFQLPLICLNGIMLVIYSEHSLILW